MVVFDATALLLLLRPDAPAPKNPESGETIKDARQRIEYLVSRLEEAGTKILIPTPALSEVLVRAGEAGPEYLEVLNTSAVFKVVPFDTRAAVEVAALAAKNSASGDKRGRGKGTWAKIKYDRQIVAIARVEQAAAIYSDDENVKVFANELGIQVIGVADLPLPPVDPQMKLGLEARKDGQENKKPEN